jgi:hypothetical protein
LIDSLATRSDIALVRANRSIIARKLMHCRMVIGMAVSIRPTDWNVRLLSLSEKAPIRRMARAEGKVCLFADAIVDIGSTVGRRT